MKEVTLYIADNGNVFHDRWECEKYEWTLTHEDINLITFVDGSNQLILWSFDDKLYNEAEEVIVPTEKSLEALHSLADMCGWLSFKTDITGIGHWFWNYKTNTFENEVGDDNE